MNEAFSDLPTNSLMADKQRIKLEPEQASLTPFPPGCAVTVMDGSRIECSGEVTSVYVSFARNSGSCDNSYRIISENLGGERRATVVPGSEVRYAIDCPIRISTPDLNQAIDGVIKGFEIQEGSKSSFAYTVEVMKRADDIRGNKIHRHRGIGPEHIRFRPTTTRTNYFDDGKTVISFDDNSTSSKDDPEGKDATSSPREYSNECSPQRSLEPNDCSPHRSREPSSGSKFSRKNISIDTTFPSPRGNPSSPYLIQDPTSTKFTSPYNDADNRNCVPLSSPIPTKFLGDMDRYRNSSIIEFSSVANFPNTGRNQSLPEGMKACVMCSKVRPTSLKKKGGKSPHSAGTAIIPNQNKGLCTNCDVQIWVIKESGQQIKWCKGCKNFQHWASFGEKGGATKCVRCRERQREKYAASKLEKELKRKARDHLSFESPDAKKFRS